MEIVESEKNVEKELHEFKKRRQIMVLARRKEFDKAHIESAEKIEAMKSKIVKMCREQGFNLAEYAILIGELELLHCYEVGRVYAELI